MERPADSADQLRLAHAALAERGIPLASIENGYSLLDRRVETNGVLDACRELGVTLIAQRSIWELETIGRRSG